MSSSGRLVAWKGAFHTASSRPVAGFGFGTEDRVFVDRYYFFVGGRPENAYLGFYLQLGLLGLLGFVAVGVALLPTLARLVRRGDHQERSLGVVFAASVLAGFATAATQSYPYSAGNVATLTFWVAVFGLATARTGSHD